MTPDKTNTQPEAVDPCPFCNGDLEPDTEWATDSKNERYQRFYFVCATCHARTSWAPNRAAALMLANHRAPAPPLTNTLWEGLLCKCTHRHDQHHPIQSVNYSAGHCKKCACQGFVILGPINPMAPKCTCRTLDVGPNGGPHGNGHAEYCEWGKANPAPPPAPDHQLKGER